MKSLRAVSVSALLSLACLLHGAAQERGRWRPVSNTARSITGELAFTDSRLLIGLLSFPIAEARALTPAELTAAFVLDTPATGKGHLYRVDLPGSKVFLNKNTLCGSSDVHWLVTYVEGRSLQVAMFSSQSVPVFTAEAIANSTDLCGTYSYDR